LIRDDGWWWAELRSLAHPTIMMNQLLIQNYLFMMPGCETNFLLVEGSEAPPSTTKKLDFTKARP